MEELNLSPDAKDLLSNISKLIADVEYGKNLETHLYDIETTLPILQKKIDEEILRVGKDNVSKGYFVIGYTLYYWKDKINEIYRKKGILK